MEVKSFLVNIGPSQARGHREKRTFFKISSPMRALLHSDVFKSKRS